MYSMALCTANTEKKSLYYSYNILNANSVKSIPRNNKFEKENKFWNWQFQQMILCRAIKSLLGDPNIIHLCSPAFSGVKYGYNHSSL